MKRLRPIAGFLLLAGGALAQAAGHGSLTVTVLDEQGQAVADAKVRVTIKHTWQKFERRCDDEGHAFYFRLPVGEFRTRVEASGYRLLTDARPCLVIVGSRHLKHTVILKAAAGRGRPRKVPCPRLAVGSDVSTRLEPLIDTRAGAE